MCLLNVAQLLQYLFPILVDHENVKMSSVQIIADKVIAADLFCDTVSSVSRCDNVKNIGQASGLPSESKACRVYSQVVVLLAPNPDTNQRSF